MIHMEGRRLLPNAGDLVRFVWKKFTCLSRLPCEEAIMHYKNLLFYVSVSFDDFLRMNIFVWNTSYGILKASLNYFLFFRQMIALQKL